MLPHVTIEPRRDRETAAGGFRVSYHDSPLQGEPGPGMARDTEPSAVTRRQRQQAGLPQEGGGRWPLSDTGGEPGPAAADPGPGHHDQRFDEIGPWRALTDDVLREDAGFLPVPTAVQWMETSGGWAEGDAAFSGPSRSTEAFIPYYQRSRHIFGDLKIEILDAQGKLVDEVPTSKHRGVSRATWPIHPNPRRAPPAATAAFAAAVGPRVLPGDYVVRMTRGDKVYTTQLTVALDPRAQFTVADRKAQFDLVNRIGALLNHMSWAVDRSEEH